MKAPFLTSYHEIWIFSSLAWFSFLILFKHRKHIVILTHPGNMSILNQVCYCLPCILCLTLETYILILYSKDLIVLPCDGNPMFSLNFNNGLLMNAPQVINRLVSQLLSNMWKHCVTAMLSKVSCFWLFSRKQKLICPHFIDVIVVHSWVLDQFIKFTAEVSSVNWCLFV